MIRVMNAEAKRSYDAPARREQLARTRARIVEALTEQIYLEGLADFSVPQVAERAGVSTRTVYRHFPTREDLLDAVEGQLAQTAPEPTPPRSTEDLVRYVGELFVFFDEHQELIEAQTITQLGGEIMHRSRARRYENARRVMKDYFPDVADARERRKRFALVRGMMSSRYYRILTRENGLSRDEAIEIVAWAIEAILAAAERRG